MNKITIDIDNLPEIPGYDREAQKSIVKYLTTGEADLWEFWDTNDSRIYNGPLTWYRTGFSFPYYSNGTSYDHARLVKPFDTKQGNLTDADSMNGNTPHRRPLVRFDITKRIGNMLGVHGDKAFVRIGDSCTWAYGYDTRLATNDEVAAAGMPREWAGLRD